MHVYPHNSSILNANTFILLIYRYTHTYIIAHVYIIYMYIYILYICNYICTCTYNACIHNACVPTWFVSMICTRWMTIPLNSKNHRYSLTYLRSDISLFKNSHIMYFIIVQVLFRALMGFTIPCFWLQSIHIVNPTIIYSFSPLNL